MNFGNRFIFPRSWGFISKAKKGESNCFQGKTFKGGFCWFWFVPLFAYLGTTMLLRRDYSEEGQKKDAWDRRQLLQLGEGFMRNGPKNQQGSEEEIHSSLWNRVGGAQKTLDGCDGLWWKCLLHSKCLAESKNGRDRKVEKEALKYPRVQRR